MIGSFILLAFLYIVLEILLVRYDNCVFIFFLLIYLFLELFFLILCDFLIVFLRFLFFVPILE